MKKTKNLVSVLVAGFLAVSMILASCGNAASEDGGSETSSDGKVVGTYKGGSLWYTFKSGGTGSVSSSLSSSIRASLADGQEFTWKVDTTSGDTITVTITITKGGSGTVKAEFNTKTGEADIGGDKCQRQSVVEVKAATTAEAISAIKNMKAGQTLKLELGSGVTLTEDFLTAIIQNVPYGGKIELRLPPTMIVNDSILRGWFDAARELTAINIEPGHANYSSVDGVLYNRDKTEVVFCPRGKTGNVKIATGTTSIGNRAFDGCEFLTGVSIPSGVVTISERAFGNCVLIKSLNISTTVTTIDSTAFDYCKSLTAINVDDGNTKYSSGDGVLYNKGKTELICCPRGKTNVVVPNSVNAISARAFFTCTSLSSVTVNCDVPPSTTDAFWGFEVANVPSVYVPASAVDTYKAASGWSAYAERIFPIQ